MKPLKDKTIRKERWCVHNKTITGIYERCLICNPIKPKKEKSIKVIVKYNKDGTEEYFYNGIVLRNPEPKKDEDPRKFISEAPSFEEYLKKRQAEGN